MAKLEHFSHECALTLPATVVDGICNICHKDEAVEFTCKSCNYDLCKTCSELPQKVSHDFHPEHPLELCLAQYDRKPHYVICSGCGNMCSSSFYECRECEIYLDLGCALLENTVSGWDIKELLHYSHCHLLRRCRPGPDARGSCLLFELPLTPSAICYGCVYCYSFFHESCLDLPTQIQHPVHPAHPLVRLDYIQNCGVGRYCDACELSIVGVPFGCLQCNLYLHMRCADALLRGLMLKYHEHKFFYVATGAHRYVFSKAHPCQICMTYGAILLNSYYHCTQCEMNFHFECLKIPDYVVKKSVHIHPLMCKTFLAEDDSLEYCGVCETTVRAGHHAYSCEKCDFIGHIECILCKETHSPLYLKDLYPYREDMTRSTGQEGSETNKLRNKLMVNDINHIHVMRLAHMSELEGRADCNICQATILGKPCKCETCSFQTHHFCAELGQPSNRRRLHEKNHPLTLLPNPPAWRISDCDICRTRIYGFNLFCRICNFIIDINCALRGKHSLVASGHKVIESWSEFCLSSRHSLVQLMVSRSYPTTCAICDDKLDGDALSCMTCGDIYHIRCYQLGKQLLHGHQLHSGHILLVSLSSGSKCTACKLEIRKHGYKCTVCEVRFHFKCIRNMSVLEKSHMHSFYNFWMDDSRLIRVCGVCA